MLSYNIDVYKDNVQEKIQDIPIIELSENANNILKMRYLTENESCFRDLCMRVATVVSASAAAADKNVVRTSIYKDMVSHRFLFNSPCLFSAGSGLDKKDILSLYTNNLYPEEFDRISNNKSKNQMLFACFVISIGDSIEEIFDSAKNAAIISKYGGGVGANFSHIREKNASIKNGLGGQSSGPVSFMETWNTMGSVVVQGGKRRAALMGMLNVSHPDIEEFINCKTEDDKLSVFNISVAIDDKFMNAVKNNEMYDLVSPFSGDVIKSVNAKKLWDSICEKAHKRGDPGIFFVDIANKDSLLSAFPEYKIESTNPCGEQGLPNFTSCNLGSINVAEFVINDENTNELIFDELGFYNQVLRGIHYLDAVIDASGYPLDIIEKNTKNIRPVGLGIMGLADLAIKLGIEYGSDEFYYSLCSTISTILAGASLRSSMILANLESIKAKDDPSIQSSFYSNWPNEDKEKMNTYLKNFLNSSDNIHSTFKYAIKSCVTCLMRYEKISDDPDTIELDIHNALLTTGIRNSRRLSIAPTGTIALLLDTSSSIEPNFAFEWTRTVTTNDNSKEQLTYYHALNTTSNKEKGLLISAHDLTPIQHCKVVKEFAKCIDSSISKTVNLPNNATVDDVKKVYEYCHKHNIKGITIYRDGSRSAQPIVKKEENTNEKRITPVQYSSEIKARPKVIEGVTVKTDSPYGSIYLTANFDKNELFEVFISAGKSGTVAKSITEGFSRVISLALRSGVDINNIIKTISNISESDMWIYDTIDGKEIYVKSIPDSVANMLIDVIKYKENINNCDFVQSKKVETLSLDNGNREKCPTCGAALIMVAGCKLCIQCGFSPCK